MQPTPHSRRIVSPISYIKSGGKRANIRLGPCLIEPIDARQVDIIRGSNGEYCTSLSVQALKAATAIGYLVLLNLGK